MIIECSILPHVKGLKIKAKQKGGQAIAIAYNSNQSLIDNAKYALLSLCLILGIKGKSFVWCIDSFSKGGNGPIQRPWEGGTSLP